MRPWVTVNPISSSGGLPIRQNRQLPKARHGAGARRSWLDHDDLMIAQVAVRSPDSYRDEHRGPDSWESAIDARSLLLYAPDRHITQHRALLCIVFMLDVHVFVKQHEMVDLVQYIVLTFRWKYFFCFYCITVRPANRNLSLPKARNIVICHWFQGHALQQDSAYDKQQHVGQNNARLLEACLTATIGPHSKC